MTERMSAQAFVQQYGRTTRRRHGLIEGMNATEQIYAKEVHARYTAGEIAGWAFEMVAIRLEHNTTYTPDFIVFEWDGLLFVEIKGRRVEDDASVKFKWARNIVPWARWVMLRRVRNRWEPVKL